MKRLLVALSCVMLLPSCGPKLPTPQVTVDGAVVSVPAVPAGAGAAYFTLNTNFIGTRLVSISSSRVRSIELHESKEQGGRTQMVPLQPDDIVLSPGSPLVFDPGGKHAMLVGVDPSLRPGEKLTLIFQVEPLAQPVTVEADVRGPGDVHASH